MKGEFYVCQNRHGGGWDVHSECDDDELVIEHVPNEMLAKRLCDAVNFWITEERLLGKKR